MMDIQNCIIGVCLFSGKNISSFNQVLFMFYICAAVQESIPVFSVKYDGQCKEVTGILFLYDGKVVKIS